MYSSLFALAASISTVAAATQGFNYGAVTRTGATKSQADFEAEFAAAKGLANTNGAFSSARLYTTIQAGTDNTPISAIPAAIAQDTKLFLGMWASSGDATIKSEIAALTSAIETYGEKFTSRVSGISVGSEDLYRITPTGLMNNPLSVGAGPDEIVKYIQEVRKALSGTALSKTPIGHVDTWTAWQNGSNSAVIDEADFLGFNTFPYFQTTDPNSIDDAATLFTDALAITEGVSKGKPVIVTETGWPVGGKTSSLAVPSTKNAKTYWDQVGCSLFGQRDVFWYTLVDANTDTASQPQFGVVGTTLSTTPLFDLTCSANSTSKSSSSSSTATATSGSATGTGMVSVPSSSATGSSGGSASGTGITTPYPTTTGSGSGSSTSPASPTQSTFNGAASTLSGSKMAMGGVAVVAAVMALL